MEKVVASDDEAEDEGEDKEDRKRRATPSKALMCSVQLRVKEGRTSRNFEDRIAVGEIVLSLKTKFLLTLLILKKRVQFSSIQRRERKV